MTMKKCASLGFLGGLALLSIALVSGCASIYQKREVTGSGFLKNYDQLKDYGGDTAMLSYIDPKANFRGYTKILLEPVCAYVPGKDSPMGKLSKEKQQMLVNYFDAALREKLTNDYSLVSQPGPEVMRVRVAITEAKGARVVLDTVSTVMPIGLIVSSLKAAVTGTHLNVGSIGAECEGLDSVTGQRLFAAVDARVGRKITGRFDKFSRWRTAEDAMDFWAGQLGERLREKSGRAKDSR